MIGLKKRTIALCLASALTVVGAFGAENYKNALMALKINVGSGGYVNLTAYTEKPYNMPIKTAQIDKNTFVLTLLDTKNSAQEPDIENYENIESISISTYPYTIEADGYTRIVVKTLGAPRLQASNALFIPDNLQYNTSYADSNENYEEEKEDSNPNSSNTEYAKKENTTNSADNIKTYTPPDYSKIDKSANGTSVQTTSILVISILLIIIGLVFMFSKEKMANIVGDNSDIDINDSKQKKQSKTKKLKSTINKLDKKYNYTNYANIANEMSINKSAQTDEKIINNEQPTEEDKIKEEEKIIVDLDTLYQEAQKTTPTAVNIEADSTQVLDEEDDLADLLNSFVTEEVEEEPFDEELYNSIISSTNLIFSDSDITKINTLMLSELSEEMINELHEYQSSPHKKPLTKQQILEELLSTYSIKQNINFSQEDVDAIRKLMAVELGPDFTKDFTTNPVRTKIVEKEIKEQAGLKSHKTSEILTLNVKNMLPNLSEELKKYGGKTIKSEAKPEVVYYSEGYEYEKLHVSNELSDIAESIKKDKTQNEHKPSYQVPIVDTGYEVSTLEIKDSLPDLADVRANPHKYEDKKIKKPVADENALLKSIANVTFKPFYEDVENELNQFDNFEIINHDNDDYNVENNYYQESNDEPTIVEIKSSVPEIKSTTRKDDNAIKLLKLIETQQAERAQKKQIAIESAAFKNELMAAIKKEGKTKQKEEIKQSSSVYNYNGKEYTILKTIKCTQNGFCRFIQADNKFAVIGNLNGNEYFLREYEGLNNSTIQIRQNDKSDKTKFLVKVDNHKFILSITENNMELVMNLC